MPALCGVALLSLLKTLTNRHSGLPWSRSCLRLCYRFCLRFNLRFCLRFCSRFYLRLSRCKCLSCSCFTGRFDFVFLTFLLFGLLAIWWFCLISIIYKRFTSPDSIPMLTPPFAESSMNSGSELPNPPIDERILCRGFAPAPCYANQNLE